MIHYAVVIFYPNKSIGLTSKTWKDGIEDIKAAEKTRLGLLEDSKLEPKNVQVISYRSS